MHTHTRRYIYIYILFDVLDLNESAKIAKCVNHLRYTEKLQRRQQYWIISKNRKKTIIMYYNQESQEEDRHLKEENQTKMIIAYREDKRKG